MNQEDASLGDSAPLTLLKARLIAWDRVGASIRNTDLPRLFKGKLSVYAALSPLILALIVVGGLGILCAENLGGATVRQMNYDHSEAIRKLLFRN